MSTVQGYYDTFSFQIMFNSLNVLFCRAETDAAAILNDFRREAEVYRELKETLSLDNDAFLSYMNTRALEGATNPVYISLDAPSKSTYLEL